MACDKDTLERVRHTALNGTGPTATWARKRLIEIDPEWAKEHLAQFIAPAAPVPATPTPNRYVAEEPIEKFAVQIRAFFGSHAEDMTLDRITDFLRDCEASDIPT